MIESQTGFGEKVCADMKDMTHNPDARSWVASANAAETDFPIQNLPLGRFRHNPLEPWQIGVAIGDRVLDLHSTGLIDHNDMPRLLEASNEERQALRLALWQGLVEGSALQKMWSDALLWQTEVELGLPCDVHEFIRFESRAPWAPCATAGRRTAVGVSGQQFRRPIGLRMAHQRDAAQRSVDSGESRDPYAEFLLGETRMLGAQPGFGAWLRADKVQGSRVGMDEAEHCIAGVTLINHWCAHDLGPTELDANGFATTTSPWIVTAEALVPFRLPHRGYAPEHLDSLTNRRTGGLGLKLEVWLQTAAMRAAGKAGMCVARTDDSRLDWTLAQLISQLALNGSPIHTGTLLGAAQSGSQNVLESADSGALRQDGFVEDGDTIIVRGACVAEGARRIGFGECRSTVLTSRL
jgi:fumarylacetoacetase